MKNLKEMFVRAVVVALIAAGGSASAVTFTGSDAFGRSASATFDLSGGTLTITLANISTADVLVPNQVLTALFFDTNPDTTLTPVSAMLAAGSATYFGPNVQNVSAEWAYGHNLTGIPGGSAEQGTSSTGLGLFSPSDNFQNGNLQGPVSVDGLQYGLTSAEDNLSTGNAAVTGGFALTKNAVVLTLTAVPASFEVSNVRFLYGTSLTEPVLVGGSGGGTPGVPDSGSTLALLGTVLCAFSVLRKRLVNC